MAAIPRVRVLDDADYNIGQLLARLEIASARNVFLDRSPGLRTDDRFPAPEVSGFGLRGPQALHVRFD